MTADNEVRVVRVLPDVAAIDKTFDYAVPHSWSSADRDAAVRVGAMVRVELQGRRVAGWVIEGDVEPSVGMALKPLAKFSGLGPPEEVIELARWVAWRWAGRLSKLISQASPPRMVRNLPAPIVDNVATSPSAGLESAFDRPLIVVRHPPNASRSEPAIEAARHGPCLIIAPSVDGARRVSQDLRRAGAEVALLPRDWALAAAGGRVVVGARNAVWAPIGDARSIVVLDEQDEAHQDERNPTWHARDVAIERARRAGIPCVLVSPAPSLEALVVAPLMKPSRSAERESWPALTVLDRRSDDPVKASMLTTEIVPVIRDAADVVCVLNRRGRSRLLACSSCGEIARCAEHDVPLRLDDAALVCPVDEATRPVVCANCGATRFKNLRVGVTRVGEELEALARRTVTTLDGPLAESSDRDVSGLMIGTEAALHRAQRADAVIFLDFDQELLAQRYRANEQAFGLLVRAARLLGSRSKGGRLIVQTRQPDHSVLDAAMHADPARLARAEATRRRALTQPPFSAEALVSGSAAAEFVGPLRGRIGIDVRGPLDGAWLVRCADHQVLCDALDALPPVKGRVRVEVDPLRI
ncbi:MAG: hypothetical protein IH940_04960 [Acidobacteria bacterium]|nr:hypothetical protein [Acidobacteriota bacterium]